jgi:hypothetical protein
VLTKLREISEQDIAKIGEALVRDMCTQFLKSFSWCLLFGTKDIHECAVCSAGLEKLPTDQDLRVPDADKDILVLEERNGE